MPSSSIGYRAAIGARQERQRPASRIHESTGTLSYAAIGLPQCGQREPGNAIDSSRGSRCTITFRKLPTTRPSSPAATSPSEPSAAASGGVMRASS